MRETKIKEELKKANVCQWELAEKVGLSEQTFSRKLRKELNEKTRNEYLKLIKEIKKEKSEV